MILINHTFSHVIHHVMLLAIPNMVMAVGPATVIQATVTTMAMSHTATVPGV